MRNETPLTAISDRYRSSSKMYRFFLTAMRLPRRLLLLMSTVIPVLCTKTPRRRHQDTPRARGRLQQQDTPACARHRAHKPPTNSPAAPSLKCIVFSQGFSRYLTHYHVFQEKTRFPKIFRTYSTYNSFIIGGICTIFNSSSGASQVQFLGLATCGT